jgi:2-C-methyl-D-erythritol 4-phosphate cytidylyltransferase/2-C-methyl-D-erythritol 2,4-cyclodiphosphate synthase
VVLAAGRGLRFGADKAVLRLRGKPLWRYSFETFLSHPGIDAVGIVGSAENLGDIDAPEAAFVEVGGDNRTESSRIAVGACQADRVLIHDAARPFVSPALIDRVVQALDTHEAVAPALPVSDTIRRVTEAGTDTPDRSQLFTMQTPQAAQHKILQSAYSGVKGQFTDEMALLESIGIQPTLVAGETSNFKVTMPDDLARAAAYLGPPEIRTGIGYDIHAVSQDPGRKLYLGGLEFEGQALEGHSDADVLLHALTDALLGAAGLGDIGQHFPNNDPRWSGQRSPHFLEFASKLVRERGWQVVNLDVSLIAEFPRVMPRAAEMRASIASTIGIEPERVSIKATTNEGLGAIGRREGIAAFAVATIRERW